MPDKDVDVVLNRLLVSWRRRDEFCQVLAALSCEHRPRHEVFRLCSNSGWNWDSRSMANQCFVFAMRT